MTTTELLALVRRRGFDARMKKDEVQLHTCVFCGNDRWNLELNAMRGVYHCWACRASGTVQRFASQQLGEDILLRVDLDSIKQKQESAVSSKGFTPVQEVKSAVMYLQRRGLTTAMMHTYGLLVDLQEASPTYTRIMVPLFDYFDRAPMGFVGRSYIPGMKPKYMTTMSYRYISGWRSQLQRKIHVVVEGPFDGIATHAAGYNAAVLEGTDSPDFEAWAARLPSEELIVICLDGTATAEAERLKWKLSGIHDRVRLAEMPAGADPASLEAAELREVLCS